VEVVIDPQRQIHHFHGLGDHLRAAPEPREKMTNVAVVLFDGDGQVFAGDELALRNEAVITLPIRRPTYLRNNPVRDRRNSSDPISNAPSMIAP
jgi:hypothetical protein